MAVSKNWDTNLGKSEKKTLIAFLILYITLCAILCSLLEFMYFNFQKHSMLQEKRVELNEYANKQISNLKNLQIDFQEQDNIYPRDKRFNSAIYDSDEREIFSTLVIHPKDLNGVVYESSGYIHFIKEPESYYLGARYVVVEVAEDRAWRSIVFKNMLLYGGTLFAILSIFGYFLLKLLLSPMKNALRVLDGFIKDTTHELNTPVSTILSNIELIDPKKLNVRDAKRFERIGIATKTISNIYQDLTYLTLGHQIITHDELVNVSEVIEERLKFFALLCESKSLIITTKLDKTSEIFIDKNKFTRVIDNILSNAIKYNKQNGSLDIRLQNNTLEIRDSGVGLSREKIRSVFKRYVRFSSTVGGFGIGLSIVYMIVKEYNLDIDISSQENEGTCIKISW